MSVPPLDLSNATAHHGAPPQPAPVLSGAARDAILYLAEAILSLRPLMEVVSHPVRIAHPSNEGKVVPDVILLNKIAARLGAPAFQILPDKQDASTFSRVLADRLALPRTVAHTLLLPVVAPAMEALADECFEHGFDRFTQYDEVPSFDGVPIRIYTAGDPNRTAVVISAVCGMPAKLLESWIRFLAKDYFVLTWETRGLFGKGRNSEGVDGSVAAQAADAFAVMDRFGVRAAHHLGMCGGAILALIAAAQVPDRVLSVSLWHGDFDFGDACPKTNHQLDLQALMSMVAEGQITARDLHVVLCRAMIASAPADLAALVLYPYATPELLFTYCRLNGNIMQADAAEYLRRVHQPSLVVTSDDDATAHPAGSKQVAARLAHATLHIENHGNHLALFRGPAKLQQLAAAFIAGTTP